MKTAFSRPKAKRRPKPVTDPHARQAINDFLGLLRSPDPAVQAAATENLKSKAVPLVRRLILDRIIADLKRPDRRTWATKVLKEIGRVAVDQLKDEVQGRRRSKFRSLLIETLGLVASENDMSIIFLLDPLAHSDPDPEVRDAAHRALLSLSPRYAEVCNGHGSFRQGRLPV